jgi:hypothetical protein
MVAAAILDFAKRQLHHVVAYRMLAGYFRLILTVLVELFGICIDYSFFKVAEILNLGK